MLSNCPVCGKEFNAVGAAKYCSKDCRMIAKISRDGRRKTDICPNCLKEFIVSSNRQIFCSKECWTIANRDKIRAKTYKAVMKYHDKKYFNGNREIVLERDGHKCMRCDSTENIGVHHIDKTGKKDNPNHSLDNLITLCNNCHSQEHVEEKKLPRTAFMTTCQYCGNQFKTTPYKIKIGAGKYCSKECKDAGMVTLKVTEDLHPADKPNHFMVSCCNCGTKFSVPPNRIKRGTALYCSRSCRTVVENSKRAGKYKISNTENMGKGRKINKQATN